MGMSNHSPALDAAGRLREDNYIIVERDKEIIIHKAKPDIKKIYLEPTSRCNLKCITCIRRQWESFPEGDVDPGLFEKLLREMKKFPDLGQVHLGGFGEPLAHPRILDLVGKLTAQGYRVSLNTNGTLLNKEYARELIRSGLHAIYVSIDGLDRDTFKDIRVEGDLEQVFDNIKTLQALKRELHSYSPRVGLEFVLMQKNKDQLPYLPGLAKKLGAPTVLITNLLPHSEEMYKEVLYEAPGSERTMGAGAMSPPGWNRELEHYKFPEPAVWPVLEQDYVLWGAINLPRMYWGSSRKCAFVENDAVVIRWDGQVSPCYGLMYSYPYYLDNRKKEVSSYLLGSIAEEGLFEIWSKPEYVKFRHRVRNYHFPSCMDCSNNPVCDYADKNEDCWGNSPSCADCLWSQGIVRCP